MTLVDRHGRVITQEELAADYAKDLREYCGFTSAQIDARLWECYPAVMRRWQIADQERRA